MNTTPLSVPAADLHLPLERRRFPFRSATADQVGAKQAAEELTEVRRRAGEVLNGVTDLLYQRVRKRARGQVEEDEIQEIVQRCRIHVWSYSLPRFDAHRQPRTKVTTFIWQCIENFMRQEIRSRNRRRAAKTRNPHKMISFTDLAAGTEYGKARTDILADGPDARLDRRIEMLSADIQTNPDRYLLPAQVRVFRALMDSPGVLMKDLAKRLGYGCDSSLTMMVNRIRERLAAIDIASWELSAAKVPTYSDLVRPIHRRRTSEAVKTEIRRRVAAGERVKAVAGACGVSLCIAYAAVGGIRKTDARTQNLAA